MVHLETQKDVPSRFNKNMEIITEDFRTDQEKRQEAFEIFLKKARKKTEGLIAFCGDQFRVKFHSRIKGEIEVVSFDIIGERHDFEGERIAFNIDRPDDTELIKIF